MAKKGIDNLLEQAVEVLKANDRGKWTVPAGDLYPHQWLWDSCFTAIGLRHIDVERAQVEIISLLRGQWSDGMVPNIVFADGPDYHQDRELWRSRVNPFSPNGVATSGITQPPMLAEAVVKVGQKLTIPARRSWYRQMYPPLLAYHEWIYRQRDPHKEGLAILVHPYESGLDNSPPWTSELRKHSMPWWVGLFEKLHLDWMANFFRRDTRHIPSGQRISNVEALAYWSALRRLRRKAYNWEAILSRSLFAVEDLAFNAILIRANQHLTNIAKTLGETLPLELTEDMKRTEAALEGLWDETSGYYYSRSFISHKLIEEPTVACLLALYAGAISAERATRLVKLLDDSSVFASPWPLPSVPLSSASFSELKYWQGPTWVNINWLIIDGLKRNGFDKQANALKNRSLDLVQKSGLYEYFSPLNGQPAGAADFSWTAALTIDLLKQ
ncbi:hypothetical protein A3A68_01575 [Candidatus Saccharibacteria bacterium RIFCSPLOWO2_01_FULL_48_13]|nr:MAG: hypothetical protein A2884_00850 [Candidatus Saccharibacteria bacterium RIFCSPHIGHO2_01_FULL_48_12]OGL35900.1 MAG: hypothetical protein A3F38_00145 [Candidatus Saccharibacteria bacterium RIFCSPHIGHO2_12_FULL_48_21]OGL37438.1 MAG: hypothetical protein A3A68_01575 [Candidatus Saccharibacteria bacterium RIFCSPLOWO2_01_FULL_48_13]